MADDCLAYWLEHFDYTQVHRLAVAPYILEASHLVFAAAKLWTGPFGTGRVRAEAISKAACTLYNAARNWEELAFYWCDRSDISANGIGHVLAEKRDRSRLAFSSILESIKSPVAARHLIWSAAKLTQQHLANLRRLPYTSLHQEEREANAIIVEDAMEVLGEMPCAAPLPFPIMPIALHHLERHAAFAAAARLTYTASYVICTVQDRYADELRSDRERWLQAAQHLLTRCKNEWRMYGLKSSDELSPDDREALLRSEQDASFYCDYRKHYKSPEAVRRALAISRQMVIGVLQTAGIAYATDDQDPTAPVTGRHPAAPHGVPIPEWVQVS